MMFKSPCYITARGHDDIPKSIIIAAFSIIGPYILDVFNSSVRESVFSSVWKNSLVLALNEVASPRTIGEMRPIALLCFSSKVLERLMHQQLSEYCETCLLINSIQIGYRVGHSTNTTLWKLEQMISEKE